MQRVNLASIPWVERRSPKGQYHRFRREVSLAFKSPKTGTKPRGQPPFEVELVRMPPGAKNFPLHSHATEWEFYLIISGSATMRAGTKRVRIKPGDCIMNPPGEPHQIINTGRKDLLYYVIANNSVAEFCHYPESDKWGFWSDFPKHAKLFRMGKVSYYDGEE